MSSQLNIDTTSYNKTQKFQIEGVIYKINTRYNPRLGWSLSIFDIEDSPILRGWVVLPNRVLQNVFPGWLQCIDTEIYKTGEGVSRDNFGFDKRFQLVYYSLEELQTNGYL